MASFEPIVVVFGCSSSIGTAKLRVPVSCLFAFDVLSLEQIVNVSPQLSDTCLPRYFVILLDSIDAKLLTQLQTNHRVMSVYRGDSSFVNTQDQDNQMTNSFRQLTLDLTNDIVQFLTLQGAKEIKLERMSLVKIYYQQARVLKEWAMSLFKAEPCHILLISLNSSQENLDNAQQKLQKVCHNLGYTSVVIRQLNDYIPSNDRHLSLLPYARLLFNSEHPRYLCGLIKRLSPIRLYLYGNELCDLSGWSEEMISSESEIMDDEDNWCAFLENECVDDEIKWNFAFKFAQKLKVSRITPLNFSQLDRNLRFQSTLRRAHVTLADRQLEVTGDIFDWYNQCIEQGHLQVEPKLTPWQIALKSIRRKDKCDLDRSPRVRFRQLSSLYRSNLDSSKIKSISFIWLDEILHNSDSACARIIEPFQWQFFNKISNCLPFIETQLREQRTIFLIVSGSLGHELLHANAYLMQQIFATYIYCAHLGQHTKLTDDYPHIHGVFNDSQQLASQIKKDFDELQLSVDMLNTKLCNGAHTPVETIVIYQGEDDTGSSSISLTVYDQERAHLFMAHHRTINTLLCTPHTTESLLEMIAEFRRLYCDNQLILGEIDNFENTYHSNAAVQWYTRDSFVSRTINDALRSSDVTTMFKLRYILTDIYSHLNESCSQRRQSYPPIRSTIFYRGQLMSKNELESVKTLRGSIISINIFLSTTESMQVALMYAGNYDDNSNLVRVVFTIETETAAATRPYANISPYSMFPDEAEVLFAMGSIFQIGNIYPLPEENNIWNIHLKMVDLRDDRFNYIILNTTQL